MLQSTAHLQVQVLFETDVTVDTNAMEKQMRVANGVRSNLCMSTSLCQQSAYALVCLSVSRCVMASVSSSLNVYPPCLMSARRSLQWFELLNLICCRTLSQLLLQMVLNPLQSLLVPRGLHPLYYTRYRRGWRTSYSKWVQITKEIYDRPMDEQSDRFWVCLRRAYPGSHSLTRQSCALC